MDGPNLAQTPPMATPAERVARILMLVDEACAAALDGIACIETLADTPQVERLQGARTRILKVRQAVEDEQRAVLASATTGGPVN